MATPETPRARSSRPVVILAIVLGAVLVATGTVVAITRPWEGGAPVVAPSPTPTRASYPDLLAPDAVVRVGDQRWVSPCRVITASDAERIFGAFPDFSTTDEEYLDRSVPVGETSIAFESTCARGVPGEDPTVYLKLSVYPDDEIPAIVASDVAIEREDFEGRLDEIVDAKPATRAGKALVKRMRASAKQWDRANDYRGSLADLDGAVLPDGGIGATPEPGQGLRGVVGYVGFELEWRGSAAGSGSLGSRIDRLADAYALIRDRIADRKLSQSPEPTVLGTTAKVGGTRILEPCAVLDGELFQSALGLSANDAVRRESSQWDLTAARRSSRTGEKLPPRNACTRNYNADQLPVDADLRPVYDAPGEAALDAGYGNVRLDLSYYGSKGAARAAWEKSLEPEGDSVRTELSTSADAAVASRSDLLDYTGYTFLVDGWIGRVTVSLVAVEGGLFGDQVDQEVPAAVYPALISGIADRYRDGASD